MKRRMFVTVIGIALVGIIGAAKPAGKAKPAPQSQPARQQVNLLKQMFLDDKINAEQYQLGRRLLEAAPGAQDAQDKRRPIFEGLLSGRIAPKMLSLELATVPWPKDSPHPQPEDADSEHPMQICNVPDWVRDILNSHDQELSKQYNTCVDLNPFYLRGDFDGDGKMDVAMMMREKRSNDTKLIIFHQGSSKYYVWPEEIAWCEAWQVYPKQRVGPWDLEPKALVLKGEAIFAETECASILIYWNGKKYCRFQMSD